MAELPPRSRDRASREGLLEYILVAALLALAAAGVAAVFGDRIREAFGVAPGRRRHPRPGPRPVRGPEAPRVHPRDSPPPSSARAATS